MQNIAKDVVTVKELFDSGFNEIGIIILDQDLDRLRVVMHETRQARGAFGVVYVWVIENTVIGQAIDRRIGYVGFTSQNVYHRRSQWQSGLNSGIKARKKAREEGKILPEAKGRGAAIARLLKPVLASGLRITVWYRHSDRITLFNEDVSLAKCEEDALVKKYDPRWNWSGDDDGANATL